MVIPVFVVDDHELVRRGLIDLINSEADLEVVGEAGTVSQALQVFDTRTAPSSASSSENEVSIRTCV